MRKQNKEKIEDISLKYYEKFKEVLKLLMRQFEEIEILKSQFERIIGKIEALKELKKIMNKNEIDKS